MATRSKGGSADQDPPVKERPLSQTAAVRPRAKLWLEAGGEAVLCGGLSEMLKAVEETGSIKEAAARMGRSYRFVWARIKQAEKAFGAQLVETHVGGRGRHRSDLTDVARELLADFDALRSEVFRIVDTVFAPRVAETLRRHRK